MPEKKIGAPKGVHAPFSNYAHSVTVDGAQRLIFCAGQVAGDENGNVLGPDDFDAQAAQVMKNVTAVLADAGAALSDIVKVTIYICSPHDVKKGRAILSDYFPDDPPASTLCILRGLAHPDFLVEVEAIAVV